MHTYLNVRKQYRTDCVSINVKMVIKVKFQRELYCGGVHVEHTVDGVTTVSDRGWISIDDEKLAKYKGKIIKVKIEVED
jgi:hypothetical protein